MITIIVGIAVTAQYPVCLTSSFRTAVRRRSSWAAILHEEQMQRGSLRERGDLFVLRVTFELSETFPALRVHVRFLRALLEIFELDDVAVRHVVDGTSRASIRARCSVLSI